MTYPDIRANYAQALLVTQGHTAEATQSAYGRVAEQKASQIDAPEAWSLCYGRWSQHLMAGELNSALDIADSQLHAEETGEFGVAASAHRWTSLTLFHLGRPAEARDHGERAIALYNKQNVESFRAAPGMDFLSHAYVSLALPLWLLGEIDRSQSLIEQAVQRAHDLDQPFNLANVLGLHAVQTVIANRPQRALRVTDALVEVASSKSIGA
jgi:tetratricopeptide (TPR) repeat protein